MIFDRLYVECQVFAGRCHRLIIATRKGNLWRGKGFNRATATDEDVPKWRGIGGKRFRGIESRLATKIVPRAVRDDHRFNAGRAASAWTSPYAPLSPARRRTTSARKVVGTGVTVRSEIKDLPTAVTGAARDKNGHRPPGEKPRRRQLHPSNSLLHRQFTLCTTGERRQNDL